MSNRRDIRDYTGRLLGWVITELNGNEKAYHLHEGLKGWYNKQADRTYTLEGLHSFGNRVDSLVED